MPGAARLAAPPRFHRARFGLRRRQIVATLGLFITFRDHAQTFAMERISKTMSASEQSIPEPARRIRFAFTDEQEQFRAAIRRFLNDKSPTTEVRRLMATAEGYDP